MADTLWNLTRGWQVMEGEGGRGDGGPEDQTSADRWEGGKGGGGWGE